MKNRGEVSKCQRVPDLWLCLLINPQLKIRIGISRNYAERDHLLPPRVKQNIQKTREEINCNYQLH